VPDPTETADTADISGRPKRPVRSRRASSPVTEVAASLAEDRRLAALHLRLGDLALARAELEHLHVQAKLDTAGLADLAEARWRSGDLESAAAAAADHLAAGGARPIARVIAAEAAAIAGRPGEARAQVDALGAVGAEEIEVMFAGMPRHAFWPFAPNVPVGPPDTLFGADRVRRSRSGPVVMGERDAAVAAGRAEGPSPEPAMAGLWGDDETPTSAPASAAEARSAESPAESFARARLELGSANAAEADRGLARLALVLRLDPTLAPAVLDALGPRRDVAALLLRGDAYRLLGRRLEAEASLSATAQALDAPDSRRPGPRPTARETTVGPRLHVSPDRSQNPDRSQKPDRSQNPDDLLEES